jgi:hypothetical protein
MTFLEFLELLRALPMPAGERTEAGYAQLPFHLLARGAAPFDAWRGAERAVPAQLEPVWRQAAAGWQLCAFHAVNATTGGIAFAERILGLQKQFLDGLERGAGERHEAAVRKLYVIAWQPMEVDTPDGERLEVPPDWRAAVEFLLTCPDSPYRAEGGLFTPAGVPTFPDDADVALAQDLERALAAAADHFAALLPVLKSA